MKQPAVYILTNKPDGVLYIGVTSNLIQRIFQHRTHAIDGFSKKYNADKLVHFELFEDMNTALQREKNLKHWVRKWKIELIEKNNPEWRDLWDEISS